MKNDWHKNNQMAADRLYREIINAVVRGDWACCEFYMMHLARIAKKYKGVK